MPPLLMPVCAAALIDLDGRVLLQQRLPGSSHAGLWEFPGGKIEPGESPEAAVIRELEEELAISVPCKCLSPVAFASAPHGDRHFLLLLFVTRKWTGVPRALAAAALRWVRFAEMHTMPMPPADRMLIAQLEANL